MSSLTRIKFSFRAFAVLAGAVFCATALQAKSTYALLRETRYVDFVPTVEQVQTWSSQPGNPRYLFHWHDPSALELESLLSLRNFSRWQIEIGRAPTADTVPVWKKLAQLGAELVLLDDYGFPYEAEILRLNEIGFKHQLHVLSRYPTKEEARALSLIQSEVQITFRTHAYPRFIDRPGLELIPPAIPLYFINDYWPGYIHMDVLNFLPNAKAFRIVNTMPSATTLPYLKNIRALSEVAFQSENDSFEPGFWNLFDPLTMHWIASNFVPSSLALTEFFRGENRRLTIDCDQLSPSEHHRLSSLPELVDWIHSP